VTPGLSHRQGCALGLACHLRAIAAVEVAAPQVPALAAQEHVDLRRPGRVARQVLGQGLDHHGGQSDGAATGGTLGRPDRKRAIDLQELRGHRDRAPLQVDPLAAQPGQLPPAQPPEGGHQHQRPVTGRHPLGDGGHLVDGGDPHLRSPIAGRPADAAGIDRNEPGLHRCTQDAGQEPVGLGAGRRADAIGLQLGQPGPHRQRVDPGQRVGPERRPQVAAQDAAVAGLGVSPQVHRAVQPAVSPLVEARPAQPRVGPLTPKHVRLDLGQEPTGVGLGLEGRRRGDVAAIGGAIAHLVAPGRQPADGTEAAAPLAAGHQALASIRPAATKPARSASAIRTWRPTLM
jgi:hypothetical protein